MYYILYNRKTLKVEHIYNKPLTAKVCDEFYEINGIAEYNGEIPKNNWLTVDNIREELETWKENEIIESYDDNGNLVTKEVEVEKSKSHIVCDLIAHFYPKRELTEEQKAKQTEAKYNALVTKLVRQKYDANAVEALLANYAEDKEKYQEEFDTFAAYRKECKALARAEIYK